MTEGQRGNTETAAELSAGALLDAADRELIDMFLTNRLDRKEKAMVETRIVADPDFRHEVELTEAMRQGMRELARQGTIDTLLAPQISFWSRLPLAVAASIVAGLLAVISFHLYARLGQAHHELAAAIDKQIASTLATPNGIETLRFEHTRSGEQVLNVTWLRSTTPTLLTLNFDVGLEPTTGYTITINRIAPSGDATVLTIPHIDVDVEGLVAVAVNSDLLPSGDYQMRLASQSIIDEVFVYNLRVSDDLHQ